MDLKDQGRREPTMADLEAFERLLRDSLQSADPVVAPAQPALQRATSPSVTSSAHQAGPIALDANAMAELTRLIEAPLPFGVEPAVATPAQHGAEPLPPQPAIALQQLEAIPASLAPEATVFAPRAAETAPPAHDPLLAFEEELRRFDRQAAEPVQHVDSYGHLRGDFPGYAQEQMVPHAPYAQEQAQYWQGEAAPASAEPQADALAEAERRLSAEAAIAAAAAGTAVAASARRSKTLFLGLGAVALAGLAAIGVTWAIGGRKPTQTASVPVISAKQTPTKERPADAGGVEIPDQNRQVLAPKTASEPPKPAQAVNTTEQPVDLNQAVRRESVRVIAPSPFQSNPPAPVATPEPPAAPQPSSEPRRVQSVRIGDPSPPAPVAQSATPGVATGAAVAAGASTISAIEAGAARQPITTTQPTPVPAAPRAVTPPAAVLPQAPNSQSAGSPAVPAKVEARPQGAIAAVTPQAAPRPAQPAPQPRPVATPPAPRGENAPLSLTNNRPPQQQAARPAPAPAPAPAANSGGGWSVQIASRGSADEARAASSQLGSRFSSALGRTTTVTSGEANGRTVYRIRAQGYSQAEANAACERVKNAGGQCFVTR